MMKLKQKLMGIGAGCLMLMAAQANAVAVSTELFLLADVSGSLNNTDFTLQRDGYEAAFRDAGIIAQIESVGGIAVSLAYWSDTPSTAVGWTHITDAASSNAFADAIASAARSSSGSTGMARAIDFAVPLFGTNGFESDRQVIDISGDGADSVSGAAAVAAARDAALAGGVDTINAVWIEDEAQPSGRTFFCLDPVCNVNPLDYGNSFVIGGANAFQTVASSFDGFAAAITSKIGREITPNPTPLPSTLLLFGLGLAGLGWRSRSKL